MKLDGNAHRHDLTDQLLIFALVRFMCLVLSSLVLAWASLVMTTFAAKLVSIIVTFTAAYALNSRVVFG